MRKAEEGALSEAITSQAAVLSELVAAYLDRSLRRSGLSMGAFELLSAVKASPASRQAELSARLGITPSSLCEAVQAAVAKGFLEQEGHPDDRRAKRLRLTRKGGRVLDDAIKTLQEAEAAATAGLAEAALVRALETLRQASRNLKKNLAES